MFHKTNLKNGLRIITVPDKKAQTATVLLLVGAGSKYETKENNGISHFLEHMFFKGTKKRQNALRVAETLDKIGGAYNAFTSKEYTGYWAKVSKEHLGLALDWVCDIFLNSKIESKEIEKEKGVIVEELNMYLDTPMQYIEELWEKLLYGDQPAGRETIGLKKNIQRFQRKDFMNYLTNHYSSKNTIICIAGNFDPKNILSKVKNYFKNINKKNPISKDKVLVKQKEPKILLHYKKTDQTHLCLGVRGYDIFNSKKYIQQILAVILGGNMSSRLFASIREKRGLAYYVRTYSETYTDSGYLMTQAGIPHKAVGEVIRLIIDEYRRISEEKISIDELQKAKDYIKGISSIRLEPSDAKASFYGMQELLEGQVLTLREKFKMIDKVSREDVQAIAKEMFQSNKLNLALITPQQKSKLDFQKILKF